MSRTWQDNADEFRALLAERDQRYGWRLAIRVACSVEPGTGDGARGPAGGGKGVARATPFGKVSAREFAERTGTSRDTVLRYLDRWSAAITAGAPVPPAHQLTPGDVDAVPVPDRPFNGPGGYVSTRTGSNENEMVGRNADRLADALRTASPEIVEAAADRLSTDDRTKVRLSTGRAAAKAYEAEVIANGGRVPTPEETNPHPSHPALDSVSALLRDWADVERKFTDALAALQQYGAVMGDHADQVRDWALAMMDALDVATQTSGDRS